jgi:ABC-type molybdate transport system substrate-binding protein
MRVSILWALAFVIRPSAASAEPVEVYAAGSLRTVVRPLAAVLPA